MSSNEGDFEGKETRICRHPTEPLIAYPSGNCIIVCSPTDPSDAYAYKGHSAPTTTAKFSPNGAWVVSGDSTGFVRIWSWDDVDHLTKLATQLFSGPVCHIDWDVESKIILALGENSGSDKQVAKSLNFDTSEHSTPAGTPRSESRSPFLSGLSPREKISISVRNDAVKYQGDRSEQVEVDAKHTAKLLTSASYRQIPSAYTDEEIRTALSCQNTRSASSAYPSERNGAVRSPSAPTTPNSMSRSFAPTSASSSQLKSSTRRGLGTPGSDTILDRLRSVEGILQFQDECNSSLERKIQDLDDKLLMVDSSIHPAILELQQRFERELGALRRDNENRNALQCDENTRLHQHAAALTRENDFLKRKVEDLSVQLKDVRILLGDFTDD